MGYVHEEKNIHDSIFNIKVVFLVGFVAPVQESRFYGELSLGSVVSLVAKNISKQGFLVMNTETVFETKFYLIKVNNFNHNFLTVIIMISSKWISEIRSFETSEVPKFT